MEVSRAKRQILTILKQSQKEDFIYLSHQLIQRPQYPYLPLDSVYMAFQFSGICLEVFQRETLSLPANGRLFPRMSEIFLMG